MSGFRMFGNHLEGFFFRFGSDYAIAIESNVAAMNYLSHDTPPVGFVENNTEYNTVLKVYRQVYPIRSDGIRGTFGIDRIGYA